MANINQSMQEITNEIKAKAIYDQRGDLANVIGSPAVGTDSVPVLLSKLQTNKNNLASNLGSKGVTASGTESIESLVGKVDNIITGKKWASGTATSSSLHVEVTGLNFKPSLIIVWIQYPGSPLGNRTVYFHIPYGETGTNTIIEVESSTMSYYGLTSFSQYVSSIGFKLHVANSGYVYNWIAIE